MSERIGYHLDEHVSSAIARALRQRGIDVTTSAEAGLLGADDLTQLQFAETEGRVIVTHDSDFLRLHAQGITHKGIAYCLAGTRTIGQMAYALTLIYEVMTPDEAVGQVIYL